MVALSFPPFQGSLSEGNDVMSRSHAPARKLCMCLLECVYVGVFVPAHKWMRQGQLMEQGLDQISTEGFFLFSTVSLI